MVECELDKESISKIGELISNQEFEKINSEDWKKIGDKIRGKRNISNLLKEHIKPILVIFTVIEFLISLLISNDYPIIVIYGSIPIINTFILGLVLFSISEFAFYRKEHILFSVFSPLFVMIARIIYQKGSTFLSPEVMQYVIVYALIYFLYSTIILIVFNLISDTLTGVLFSRHNEIKFNKENTIVLQYTTKSNNNVIEYIISTLFNFYKLRSFDENDSEKCTSFIFSSDDFIFNEPPMYNRLIKYYLYMHHDKQNDKLTFAFFKKFFDRLIIDETAIENNILLKYYLLNICKNLKKSTLENFEEINSSFIKFNNVLFGKRLATKIKKIDWLFDKSILFTFVIAGVVIAIFSYGFSRISNLITSHETLASGIIGAFVIVFLQFILQRKTR